MKKLILLVILLAIAIVFLSSKGEAEAAATNPNKNSHVVFYIPHQDDELLTFSVGIMNHYWNGHNVHIVLMTDGAGSNVKKKLGLSSSEFSAARTREFDLATSIMGIEPQNIEYESFKDGALSVKNAESIIRLYEKKYPKAKHKTFSWTDPHADHRNLGIALKNLNEKKVVSDARYYVRRGDNPKGLRLIKEPFKESYRPFLKAASGAYNVNNARLGWYGIGHLSVKQSFRYFEKQPLSRYHK